MKTSSYKGAKVKQNNDYLKYLFIFVGSFSGRMERKINTRLTVAGKKLTKGTYDYNFHLDKQFFTLFENTEILDADLRADIHIDRDQEQEWDISVKISGSVVLLCDRCLDRLTVPLLYEGVLDEEERAECLNEFTGQLDFTQYIYDNICLALPIQRIHRSEKECDPEMLRIWKERSVQHEGTDTGAFGKLMDLKKQ